MTAEDVLCRVSELGWTVRLLSDGTPTADRATDGVPALPKSVLNQLRTYRTVIIRHLVYVALLARANGKRIWGYDSADGRAHQTYPKKGVPDNWDRMCVEGDATWSVMPKLIPSK